MFTVGLGQCQVTVYKTYDAIKFQKIFCDIDPSHHCNVYISATAATPWPVTTHKVQTVLIPRLSADTDPCPGLASLNPLYIRNVPDTRGRYCGQAGYGYVSFER